MREEKRNIHSEDAEGTKPVKLIERTLRYKGSVIAVYDDYVEVKGHRTHWDFMHHMGAAAVLPVRSRKIHFGDSCRKKGPGGRGFSSLCEERAFRGDGVQQYKLGIFTLCEYYSGLFG